MLFLRAEARNNSPVPVPHELTRGNVQQEHTFAPQILRCGTPGLLGYIPLAAEVRGKHTSSLIQRCVLIKLGTVRTLARSDNI